MRAGGVIVAVMAAARIASADVDLRASVDWLTAARTLIPAQGAANPDNQMFQLEQAALQSELRPNLRIALADFQLVVRPLLGVDMGRARVADQWQPTRLDAIAEFTELYGVWNAASYLAIAYGLQNFQWGPAEILGPSNRIVHENGMLRNPLTLIPGKHMFRVNVSLGKNWSGIAMVETADNGEEPFVAGDTFQQKAAMKLEYAASSGANYAGVVVGRGERLDPWVGEYGALEITDALSVYADVSHRQGSAALYPLEVAPGTYAFDKTKKNAARIHTLAVAGARYVFAGGEDVRLEYVRNDAGYSEAQLDRATAAVATNALQNPALLAAYAAPGLDVIGRDYAYISLRLPDLGANDAWNIYARYLLSVHDFSGSGFALVEWVASDSLLLFAQGLASHGDDDAELTRLAKAAAFAGARYSW